METIQKIQLTDTQIAKLDAGGVVSIPATWDDFLEFLNEASYRTDYHNGHIIVMGLAGFIHELLVGRIITLLTLLSKGKGFYVAGSNVGVLKTQGQKGYYNPDVTVVKGLPTFAGDSNAIITNPFLVVEVISESTAVYDYQHKLLKYAQIESIQTVIIVDRFDQSVMVSQRTEEPAVWTNTYYYQLTDVANAGLFELPLSEIFADLPEEGV
ncbi:Uma2 family endonuclease [Arsenicibacter rosenii]|uniref:Putative restriction endonuclease domain-containing protein n=1 Tax=Arsenicibacter rosenii TaxID=1750698 RepID=A0A1S2VQM3_9BACT|nr:Uma2 family endonuclease [Arsenicibacter rosenii]OIN60476.1 hypothetical protein BLX24_06560 [Arsenicibacter rosenii]